MNYYTDVLKKYTEFSGRATRSEYWMFYLFQVIIIVGLVILDSILKTQGVLFGLYILGTFLPFLAVSVRRLHDTNRSGWWYLIALIPFGGIILIIFFVMDSQPGTNQYGPNPKGVTGYTYSTDAAATPQRDVAGELERLAALKDRGALTEDEFNERKAQLLQQ